MSPRRSRGDDEGVAVEEQLRLAAEIQRKLVLKLQF